MNTSKPEVHNNGIGRVTVHKEYRFELIATKFLRSNADSVRKMSADDDESISELADSISAAGIIAPIVVRSRGGGLFEVIAGERRLRAARLLNLPEVPCVVRQCSEAEPLLVSLTENLQRNDLNPMEKAYGIRTLLEDFKISQQELGQRIGMSQPAIAHHLQLLSLPLEVKRLLQEGSLSMGHGKVLSGIRDGKEATALALKCLSEGMSVRELEALVSEGAATRGRPRARESVRNRREELELPNGVFLVIKSSLTSPNGGGHIEIPYYSEEEKRWVLEVLSRERRGHNAGRSVAERRRGRPVAPAAFAISRGASA